MDQQHTAGARKYLKLTKTKYVCEQYTWHMHGTYNITVWGSTVQYSQVIKFRTVAGFCVLRISTTDGADDQL